MLSRQKIYVRYYEDEHCWEEWTRSIDGAGAAKEDESTGAVIGAHQRDECMALQATCGSTNAAGREVIAPPAAGAANAVESKMGRK